MKRTIAAILFALCVGAWAVAGDAQSTAQGGASAQSGASAQANKQGAQASGNSSGAAGAQAGHQSASLADGTAMNAALTSPVDAKKNKPGDPVHAKTTQATKSNGQVVIPKGSKLEGHVTDAKARGKDQSESSLGVVFDKAILKNGQEVPLNVAVQALASAQAVASETSPVADDSLAMGGAAAGNARTSGGGALGGVGSAAGGAVGAAGHATGTVGAVGNTAGNVGGAAGGAVGSTTNVAGATRGAVGGLNSAGQLTSNSQGVFGLSGMTLQSVTSSNTQGSLITSTTRNVHLDSGTQLLLVATGSAQAQATDQ